MGSFSRLIDFFPTLHVQGPSNDLYQEYGGAHAVWGDGFGVGVWGFAVLGLDFSIEVWGVGCSGAPTQSRDTSNAARYIAQILGRWILGCIENEIQNSHGARPVNQVIQSTWWTRTSRFSSKNSLSMPGSWNKSRTRL